MVEPCVDSTMLQNDIDVVVCVEVFDYGNVMPKISSVLRVRAMPTTSVSTDDNVAGVALRTGHTGIGEEVVTCDRRYEAVLRNVEVIAVVEDNGTKVENLRITGRG